MKRLSEKEAIWAAQQVASLWKSEQAIVVAIEGGDFHVASYGKDLTHCKRAAAKCDAIAAWLAKRDNSTMP